MYFLDARYLVAGNTLLIRDVSAADAGPYSCLARHALTAHTKRSRPTHLAVTSEYPQVFLTKGYLMVGNTLFYLKYLCRYLSKM